MVIEKSGASFSFIKDLLIGYCLGTANIIPGVSGGTFLLIFKIYERVFDIISRIHKSNILVFFSLLLNFLKSPGKKTVRDISQFLVKNDFFFLIRLLIGSAIAIVSLSSLMKYLIVHHFEMTYAFFFGLIFLSVIIPVRMLQHRRSWLFFFAAAGCLATVYVAAAVNPYDKVKMKSDMNQKLFKIQQDEKQSGTGPFRPGSKMLSYTGKYSLKEHFYAGMSGAASISAMVLPGISGSLVLILMGQYFEVVSAISALKTLNLDAVVFLVSFGIGMILGGLFFARLVSLVLKRYYNAAMAFLTGLMIGSLYALWPFKKYIIMPRQYIKQDGMIRIAENVKVYTNINFFSHDIKLIASALLAFAVGCWIMSFFVRQR